MVQMRLSVWLRVLEPLASHAGVGQKTPNPTVVIVTVV
jgi:hypothetical protein